MAYFRNRAIRAMPTSETTVGILDLWRAHPLPGAFLDGTAVAAARLCVVISIVAYVWALPRNWGVAPGLIAFQASALLCLSVLASQRLPAGGALRLALLSVLLVTMGMAAHQRNQEILGALFTTFPIATLLITAYGTRIALASVLLIHAIFLGQALWIGAQDPSTLSVYISISLLWSLMVASFVSLLLTRIERDFNQIGELLDQESRTLRTIGSEIRIPAATLSMLAQRDTLAPRDLHQIRDAAEQMLLVIDNLQESSGTSLTRPMKQESFEVAATVRQVVQQMGPIMQRMGTEFISDVDQSADVTLVGDRFRLRTVVSNLVRMAASRSDGFRVWLNVRGEPKANGQYLLIMDIEDNGRRPVGLDFDFSFDTDRQGEDESIATGLVVAKAWLEQMAGELRVFASPRGGFGYRVQLVLPIEEGASYQ